MEAHIADVLHECTRGADEERLVFPQIIANLKQAGVERYFADICRNETTYYLPCGESLRVPISYCSTAPALAFNPDGVAAAIVAAQTKQIAYHAFCDRIAAAGCIGYLVSIPGRRAVYYGRTGDSHTEHFPTSMP